MSSHSTLKPRIYTGSILALLIIAGIFWLSDFIFIFTTTLILMVATWEWARLINIREIFLQIVFIFLMIFLFFLALKFFHPAIMYLAMIWWLLAIGLILFYPKSEFLWKRHITVLMIMGALTLIPFALAIIQLHNIRPGYLLLGLFIVWAADSGAYIVGRRFGRHQLAKHISPNKTIEGFLGGILFSLLFALIGCILLHLPYFKWIFMLALALLTNFAAVVGDLFESMLKRSAQVKDSGNWLPGHGGLLDRIDSLTCALPVFLVGLQFFL